MKIINGATELHTPIILRKADTFLKRFAGLMFRSQLPQDEGLLLVPCHSIHMFFMRFSLDVCFITANGRIVKAAEHVKPWSFIPPVRGAQAAVELPVGTIRRYGLVAGVYIETDS